MTETDMDMELRLAPWRELANAIVAQAAKDYMEALKKLKRNPANHRAENTRNELERFFLSSWYDELSAIDGKRLMKMLKKEVNAE